MGVAKVWEEKVNIPTYGIGEPDKNPMFFEKRVYQGSTGKVYPYPVIDKIYDEKEDKEYTAVYLENEYLKVMVLPELGGRIQRAYDKTNGYDFVYYNQVITIMQYFFLLLSVNFVKDFEFFRILRCGNGFHVV